MLDGYDILVLSFTAPALAREMGRDVATFGPLFGAGFLALLCRQPDHLVPFGDLWGRKGVMLLPWWCFTFFTFMPIVDPQYSHLLAYRFLGSLGLAAVHPAAAAIVTEYVPRKHRGMMVNLSYGGFSVGAVLGGLAASRLIPIYGWRAGFWVGTVLPAILIPIVWIFMPESVEFMVATGKKVGKVASILKRVDRRLHLTRRRNLHCPAFAGEIRQREGSVYCGTRLWDGAACGSSFSARCWILRLLHPGSTRFSIAAACRRARPSWRPSCSNSEA